MTWIIIAGGAVAIAMAAGFLGFLLGSSKTAVKQAYETGYRKGSEYALDRVDAILIPSLMESVLDLIRTLRPDAQVIIGEPGDPLPEPGEGQERIVFPVPRVVSPFDQERE
jgi:hypothetical protein